MFRTFETTLAGRPLVIETCLLYTSDAADEEDSVDLGGRRITKKTKNMKTTNPRKRNSNRQL